MTLHVSDRYQVAIIGSGFAGSILATILAREGLSVVLIDRQSHPRFAVGESSTPIADMLLRRLGLTYGVEEWACLSTWAGWQAAFPTLAGGRKRGFTYFAHRPHEPFTEQHRGERSLWVAASKNDQVADTHWYRPEVDEFLFRLAVNAGATARIGDAVRDIQPDNQNVSTIRCEGPQARELRADWVIDASGQAGVLGKIFRRTQRVAEMRTRSFSTFGHFRGVRSMSDWLQARGMESREPFDADDAAQHHLLDDGWLWMLRHNNGITSVGRTGSFPNALDWSNYPTLCDLMCDAQVVDPPNVIRNNRRLQRWYDPVVGDRHIMLPTAAMTLDPLHSTGIAHALAGVDRVARIILGSELEREPAAARAIQLEQYQLAMERETRLLDQLVHVAYATMTDFQRFTMASMLYFAGAICCEERYQAGETPGTLWNADDPQFVETVAWATQQLMDGDGESLESKLRDRLKPWNTAGLLDRSVENRYAYTAAEKVARG